MPFPPPPPPPPPPAASFTAPAAAASPPAAQDANSRNQLLQSIRKGTQLKKTTTNDRSAPLVAGGKSAGDGGSGPPSLGSPNSGGSPKSLGSGAATLGRNNALAGLFAGGMPRLKPTGLDIGQSNASQSQSLSSLPAANASSLHTKMENTRRQLSIDVKNRGPPPQPPPANQKPTMPQSASDSVLTGQVTSHGRSNSTTSLNNGWPTSSTGHQPRKGYGKPHLAPKPPNGSQNGSLPSPSKPCPPPKRPVHAAVNGRPSMVARAHSMRAPKSPPIAPMANAPTFPTARPNQPMELSRIGAPPPFHQSQDSLIQTPPPPSLRPMAGQQTPPPPSLRPMAGVAARPMQRPPPPPPPPNVAPPPPPHRMPSESSLVSNGQPPPPPMRLSSIRNGMGQFCGDLETRFADMFHHPNEFPPPPPFRNLPKSYNSKSVSAKQQAPQPPTHIQLGSRMWSRDNTSTC